MTIHAPRSAAYAWHCDHPGCNTVRAEAHHTEQAHPARTAATR